MYEGGSHGSKRSEPSDGLLDEEPVEPSDSSNSTKPRDGAEDGAEDNGEDQQEEEVEEEPENRSAHADPDPNSHSNSQSHSKRDD